ncbi:MAG: hypothetical protein ABIJ96_04720 [Elusimicrobiota bacterium]
MQRDSPAKRSAVPLATSILALAVVGVLILGWHLYQRGREQKSFDASGFALAEKPQYTDTAGEEADSPRQTEDRIDYVVPEQSATHRRGRTDAARPPVPGAARQDSAPRRRKVSRAVSFYYKLKNSEKFRNSPLVREWKRDFLAYPDLQAVNRKYQKDRDALEFMVGMTKSPNFRQLLKKHLSRPEAQDFLRQMKSSDAVKDSAKTFMQDAHIAALVRHLDLANAAEEAAPPAAAPAGKMKLEKQSNIMDIMEPQ